MAEGSERKDLAVDRKDGGPPKVGDKYPKWENHCTFELFIVDFDSSFEKRHSSYKKGHTRFEIGHYIHCKNS